MRELPERPGLAAALRALDAPKRAPTEADRPPLKTFPLTKAARAALRMARNDNPPG